MNGRTLWMAGALAAIALLAIAAGPARAEGPASAPILAPTASITYTVQPGDTWVAISKKFGVSASRLIDLNNLRTRPDLLFVGETIIIPINLGPTPSFVSPFLYTVQAGDTINAVVSKFYIDKAALLQANRLASNAPLTPGATLLIPAGPHRYVVQKGDTISSIAAMFSTTVKRLLQFNPHLGSGGAIFPGNNVFVPIQYDTSFVAASIEGVGGGEGTTTGTGTIAGTSVTLSSSGLAPVVSDPAAAARAANASVISTSEFITMPSNVVNLNQPLFFRWFRLNSVRRDPARDNGAIATVVIQFRGGTGSYSVRHFIAEGSQTVVVGLPIRGIYVNPGEGELWNDIEFEVRTNCSATLTDTILFSSGSTTINARYEFRSIACPSP